MILFGELYFFACAAILLIPAIILGVLEKPIKYYGFLLTVVFVGLALWEKPVDIIYMVSYLILELVLVLSYLRIRSNHGRKRGWFWTFLMLSLAPLIICKVAGLFGQNIFAFMGISYMTFKSVQVIIEIYDDLIKEVKPFDFIYFLSFFPALSSGPIDRSRRFDEDLSLIRPKADYLELVGLGLLRFARA